MIISDNNIELIKAHALEDYPNESVGVIVDDEYLRLENIHDDPTQSFKIDSASFEAATKDSDDVCLVHSHPYDTGNTDVEDRYFRILKFDRRTPSKSDMQTAQAMNIPSAIVAVNQTTCSEPLIFNTDEEHELIGREFVHGHFDCWSAVRDYYKQKLNISLTNPPRDFNWWYDDADLDLYAQLDGMGFEEVDIEDIQEHDLVLFAIDTDIINHAAVYIAYDKIYHHLYARLSCREALHKYSSQIVKIMRSVNK